MYYTSVMSGEGDAELGKLIGQMFSFGIYSTLVAVVIGVLSDISKSLRRNETNNK